MVDIHDTCVIIHIRQKTFTITSICLHIKVYTTNNIRNEELQIKHLNMIIATRLFRCFLWLDPLNISWREKLYKNTLKFVGTWYRINYMKVIYITTKKCFIETRFNISFTADTTNEELQIEHLNIIIATWLRNHN